jgi:5-methylcytosine-specific restriction endonuclease McrA
VNLSRLDALSDAVRQRRPNSKPLPRVAERRAKVNTAKREEQAAKAAVWKRAGHRCERCGRNVTMGLDMITAGHVHHGLKRSRGGTWALENLTLLCPQCHSVAHGIFRGKL